MDFYKGKFNDTMIGGGRHIEEQGWGYEMFNFKPIKERYYGYVRVSKNRQINLKRLGANSTDDRIDGVTIIWTARHPETGGSLIIGWYKNATVFRNYQEPSKSLNRKWQDHNIGYCMVAKSSEAKLLSQDERVFKVPRGSKGMGQTNIWYGDNNPEFVKIVQGYIFNGKLPKTKTRREKKGIPRQNDPLKRIEVETRAIKVVTRHYERLGYVVSSVERDNVGWDLNAINGEVSLKLEVKGLSGKEISTELTPNEYNNLKKHNRKYRICIVTEALLSPRLNVFYFSNDIGKWTSENGTTLKLEEMISVRIKKD